MRGSERIGRGRSNGDLYRTAWKDKLRRAECLGFAAGKISVFMQQFVDSVGKMKTEEKLYTLFIGQYFLKDRYYWNCPFTIVKAAVEISKGNILIFGRVGEVKGEQVVETEPCRLDHIRKGVARKLMSGVEENFPGWKGLDTISFSEKGWDFVITFSQNGKAPRKF